MHQELNAFFDAHPEVTEALFRDRVEGEQSVLGVLNEMNRELVGKQCQKSVHLAISNLQRYAKDENIEPEMSKQLSQIVPKFRTATLMVVEKDSILQQLIEETRKLFDDKGAMFQTIELQINGYRHELFSPFYCELVTQVQQWNFHEIQHVLDFDCATENLEMFESKINLKKFRGFFNQDNIDNMILLRAAQEEVVKLTRDLYPDMFGMDSEVRQVAWDDFLGKRLILDHFSKNWDFKHAETWPEPSSFSDDLYRKMRELAEVLDWTSDNKPADDKFKTHVQMIHLRELQKKIWPKLYELCPEVFVTCGLKLPVFVGKTMFLEYFGNNLEVANHSEWPEIQLIDGELACKINELHNDLELTPADTEKVADLKERINKSQPVDERQ